MFKLAPLAIFASLTACAADESISRYADTDAIYHLIELDSAAFDGRATIAFPEAGRVTGQAPCNTYSGAQTSPYPWFNVDGVAATRMACPALDAEQAFFEALTAMELAEVAGNTLILSDTTGRSMVFEAR